MDTTEIKHKDYLHGVGITRTFVKDEDGKMALANNPEQNVRRVTAAGLRAGDVTNRGEIIMSDSYGIYQKGRRSRKVQVWYLDRNGNAVPAHWYGSTVIIVKDERVELNADEMESKKQAYREARDAAKAEREARWAQERQAAQS